MKVKEKENQKEIIKIKKESETPEFSII